MKRSPWAVALCCVLLASGCATRQLCGDEEKMRCCLLQLYTDQLMDNLIRASNGLPIIQLDYTDLTGTVTVEGTVNYSGNPQFTSRNDILLAAATALETTRTFMQHHVRRHGARQQSGRHARQPGA